MPLKPNQRNRRWIISILILVTLVIVAFWIIHTHYRELLPVWLRPKWLQEVFIVVTSLGALSATIATILALPAVQSWFGPKNPYIIPSLAENKPIRRVNYATLIARLGPSGQISWIDRKATSVNLLREHGRVAITGWMKSGKTREAAELIRVALEDGTISAIYEPTAALDLIDQEMLSQTIAAEVDDRQRCLFFVDELGLRPEAEWLERLTQCVQTIRQRRPDTYFLITIQRERLIESVQQWLNEQGFHLTKIPDLTFIQRQELATTSSKDIFDVSISQEIADVFARETDGRPYSIVFALQQMNQTKPLQPEDVKRLLNRSDVEAWAEQRRYIVNTEPAAESLLQSIVTFASAGVTPRSSSIHRYAQQLLGRRQRNNANSLLDKAAERWKKFDIAAAGGLYTIPEPLLLPLLVKTDEARAELKRFTEIYQPGFWPSLMMTLISPFEWSIKANKFIRRISKKIMTSVPARRLIALWKNLPFMAKFSRFFQTLFSFLNKVLTSLTPSQITMFLAYIKNRYSQWLVNSFFSWPTDRALLLSELGSNLNKVHHLSSNLFFELGRSATTKNLYEIAIENLTQAIALNPKNVRAIAHRGRNHRLLKRYKEALGDFNRAIEIDKDYKYAFVERGITYDILKRYEEAIDNFNLVIEIDKDYKYAFVERGITYRQLKRYEEALDNFNRAIEIDKDYKYAFVERGITYDILKRYEEAIDNFNRAIEIDKDYKYAFVERGITYRQLKRYEEALDDFNRAIEIDKDYDYAFVGRGITYRQLKRYEEAIDNFNRAIEINKDYDYAIAHRGETYRQLKRYEEALDDFNRAIEIDKNNDWTYYQKSLLHLFLNHLDLFDDSLKKSINIAQITYKQDNKTFHNTFNLSLYYLVFKEFEKSKEIYQLAISQGAPVGTIREAIQDLDNLLTEFPGFPNAADIRDYLVSAISK